MTDLKTTITAIVGAVAVIVGRYGFDLSPEQQVSVVIVALMVVGWFAKDKTKTPQ